MLSASRRIRAATAAGNGRSPVRHRQIVEGCRWNIRAVAAVPPSARINTSNRDGFVVRNLICDPLATAEPMR
jgi:hypothetical protein